MACVLEIYWIKIYQAIKSPCPKKKLSKFSKKPKNLKFNKQLSSKRNTRKKSQKNIMILTITKNKNFKLKIRQQKMKFIKIKIKTQREEEKKMKNSSINKGGLKQLIDFKINLNLNKLK